MIGWETLKRQEILDCSPWFKVFREAVRLEDRQTIVPDFYLIEAPAYVMIFAVTVDHRVAVIEQYKHAIKRRILELPAGYVDSGEEPLTGAKRELLEETGMVALHWRELGSFLTDGNRGCGTCHAYIALDAEQVTEPEPGDLQQQTLHLYDLAQLRVGWRAGDFPVIASVAVIALGLDYLKGLQGGVGKI